jgi:hypothetical protein
MSIKIVLRRGKLIPNTEILDVGEPIWDVDDGRLGVGNGEQQPRWYPMIDITGNLIFNPGTSFKSGTYNGEFNSSKIDFEGEGGKALRVFSVGNLRLMVGEFGIYGYADAVFYGSFNIGSALNVGGVTTLSGPVNILGMASFLGGLNLSLSEFAASVLPSVYTLGDLLTAGDAATNIPHSWKHPQDILSSNRLITMISRGLGYKQFLKMDFAYSGFLAIATTGAVGAITDDLSDFITKTGSTFTRASNASYWDRHGNLSVALPNVPRRNFDPYTGEPLGLRIEGRSVNLNDNSTNFTTWTATALTITPNALAVWTGKNLGTPTLLTENTANSEHSLNKLFLNSNETIPFTASFFIECDSAAVRTNIAIRVEDNGNANHFGSHFTLATDGSPIVANSAITLGVGSLIRTEIRRISSRIYRVSVTGIINTLGATNASIRVRILGANGLNGALSYPGLGGTICSINNMQAENYRRMTSYIPTTGLATAREAEIFTIPPGAFNFDEQVGTFQLLVRNDSFDLNIPIMFLRSPDIGTNINLRMDSAIATTARLSILSGGTIIYNATQTVFTVATNTKVAFSYMLNGLAQFSKDGGFAGASAIAVVPTGINALVIGSNIDGTSFWDGHILSLDYTNKRLPDAQLTP